MMEALGHISEYGLEKLKTRNHYCVSVSRQPEKEFTIGIVRLSDAEARIAELETRLKYAYEAKHRCNEDANQERQRAITAEARAEAAEALLKEIAESDDIENALDPERNKRLAARALKEKP